VRIIAEIAHATGTVDGMIGGQVMDLEAEHKRPDAPTLEYIHRAKTGALIAACLVTGGMFAGGTNDDIERLRCFGRSAGLAFQIADDILDVTQTSEQLGKTAGKDVKADKATYPSLYGLEKSAEMADELVKAGCDALNPYGDRAATLKEIAYYLVERKK
jgi:geranylgeranyl diphosphate synthase type II